jgi:urease accessory protein
MTWNITSLVFANQCCKATLVFAAGSVITADRAEAALEATRAAIEASPLRLQVAATQPYPQVIVLRKLAPGSEHAMQSLRPVWEAWRLALWGFPGAVPRFWNLEDL